MCGMSVLEGLWGRARQRSGVFIEITNIWGKKTKKIFFQSGNLDFRTMISGV